MRILISNDDGIHAPGLAALENIARALSDDVWVVAPETDQSGFAHSLTLHDPLRARKIDERRFAVRGTPTDCVIMGVRHLLPGRPDLVLSGVNVGANLADDVTYSGTVAGAIEGTLQGVRSIAFSQAYRKENGRVLPWDTAESHGPGLIRKRVLLVDIVGAEVARSRLLEGWGIHYTRRGWLYNVSGRDCVLIRLRNGKSFLVGSDDAMGLWEALQQRIPPEQASDLA